MAVGKRYRHFLEPLQPRPGVRNVLCLGVSGTVGPDPRGGRARIETLRSWCLILLQRRKRSWDQSARGYGTDPREFWDLLFEIASQVRVRWALCYGGTRVASLLRLWEEIEDGRIVIGRPLRGRAGMGGGAVPDLRPHGGGRPTGPDSPDVPRVPLPAAGGASLEDPPFICPLQAADSGAGITLWDVANWGCPTGPLSAEAEEAAERVAAWWESLCHLTTCHSLPGPAPAPGAWSMEAFRQSSYSGGIYMHTHSAALDLEAASYYGGRCEARRIGPVPSEAVMLDRRSAYLYACWASSVPVALERYHPNTEGRIPPAVTGDRGIIARVRVVTQRPVAPCRVGGDIIYPVGRFWTVLCGPELELAEDDGRIDRWGPWAEYRMDYALRSWALKLAAVREDADRNGNRAVAAAIKTAGLALVGKLGQRRRRWERWEPGDGRLWYGESWGRQANGQPGHYRWIAGQCYLSVDRGWATDANPAMAAWITSWARVSLWRTACQLGLDRVYYLDTDCWITDAECQDMAAEIGTEGPYGLGRIELRHGPAHCEIHGIKHYRIGSKIVQAGIPRGMLVEDQESGAHWFLPSAGEQIGRGGRPGVEWIPGSGQAPGRYRHGTVQEDGRVVPLALWED